MLRRFFVLILWLFPFVLPAQKLAVDVGLEDERSFSMILLPDVQNYSKFDLNQPVFELMTAWSANHLKRLNVLAVLCTGDLVEQNELRIPDGKNGNQTSEEQWRFVSGAFERLDHKVPYIICTGNHDYGYRRAENRLSRFPYYFPSERNSCWRETLVETADNAFGIPTLENAAYAFETSYWGKMLVLSVEFAPRKEILDWAGKISALEKYKDHKIILLTHSYMEVDASVIEQEGYMLSPANYGKKIWEEVVYPSENIVMVICGHACKIGSYAENVSFRTDKNRYGRSVAQMMFNAQTADGSWIGNGGDGWLRLMEFLPDGRTIRIRTFSPLFGISPKTADKAWRTESCDQFEIVIDTKK